MNIQAVVIVVLWVIIFFLIKDKLSWKPFDKKTLKKMSKDDRKMNFLYKIFLIKLPLVISFVIALFIGAFLSTLIKLIF